MIELYDPTRLGVRRDRGLILAATALLLCVAAMSSQALWLKGRLDHAQGELAALRAVPPPGAAPAAAAQRALLLSELQRQVQTLERQADAFAPAEGAGAGAAALRPSQWMVLLGQLAQPGISLQKVEIDRAGNVRVEGLATQAAALDAFVQAWQRHDDLARIEARSIEARVEADPAGGAAPALRFQLRATPPAPRG